MLAVLPGVGSLQQLHLEIVKLGISASTRGSHTPEVVT
jgi:hypothetical protein